MSEGTQSTGPQSATLYAATVDAWDTFTNPNSTSEQNLAAA